DLPRLILYYQTTHDSSGRPISMLPLINKQRIALTHLIVGALHVNANNTIHLNDFPPQHPIFHTLWNETRILQSAGIKVLAMVGGAAPGSFARSTLDAPDAATFEASYALLRDTLAAHGLDGVDIDVEEPMTQRGIARLVERLHADFGRGFAVTLAPVATAMVGLGRGWGSNLSGFDYEALDRRVGSGIGWYNVQFYNGFGSMATTAVFDRIVGEGGWDPRRIVVGQLTSPENGGGGFVRPERLEGTVRVLRKKYGEIGGVVGWEYFNGVPGGLRRPWEWAEVMTGILRPGRRPTLRITEELAESLSEAWVESAVAA
ncbi:glycoside hydrolase family 18 protein, partial [Parathielavia hyrcaniae]